MFWSAINKKASSVLLIYKFLFSLKTNIVLFDNIFLSCSLLYQKEKLTEYFTWCVNQNVYTIFCEKMYKKLKLQVWWCTERPLSNYKCQRPLKTNKITICEKNCSYIAENLDHFYISYVTSAFCIVYLSFKTCLNKYTTLKTGEI